MEKRPVWHKYAKVFGGERGSFVTLPMDQPLTSELGEDNDYLSKCYYIQCILQRWSLVMHQCKDTTGQLHGAQCKNNFKVDISLELWFLLALILLASLFGPLDHLCLFLWWQIKTVKFNSSIIDMCTQSQYTTVWDLPKDHTVLQSNLPYGPSTKQTTSLQQTKAVLWIEI